MGDTIQFSKRALGGIVTCLLAALVPAASATRLRAITRLVLMAAVAVACIAGMPSIARAVNYTWDASGGSPADDGGGTWSSSGGTNWLTGSTYGAWGNTTSDVAFFGVGNGAAGTITVSGSVATNGITFTNAGSGNYTLTGGTIGFGGTTPTITVNATGTSSIASLLRSTTASLRKAGTGTLLLSGSGSTLAGIEMLGGVLLNTGSLSANGHWSNPATTLENQGWMTLTGDVYAATANAAIVNSGTFVATSKILYVRSTGAITNSGSMSFSDIQMNASGGVSADVASFTNNAGGVFVFRRCFHRWPKLRQVHQCRRHVHRRGQSVDRPG